MKRSSKILSLAAPLVALGATGVALAAASPSVSTGSASSTQAADGTATVVFHGTVNPNGAATSYHFEWGLNASYGESSPAHSAGQKTKSVSVSFTANRLIPGTVYHYRLDATSAAGTTLGADRTLTTAGKPPAGATTGPANSVTQTSADMTGLIVPNGETTNYVFQYGPTASYGYSTFGGSVPAGGQPVTVSDPLVQLEPGATFHYRIVAYHGSVPTVGADATFVTQPNPRPHPGLQARTTPGQRARRPYAFTTTGKVSGPTQFPAADSCTGTVTVRFLVGRRQFTHVTAPLGSDCTFAIDSVLRGIPGQTRRNHRVAIRAIVDFSGNGYLAPRETRATTLTVG